MLVLNNAGSPPSRDVACLLRNGLRRVHFDHVLDVIAVLVGRSYQYWQSTSLTHASWALMLAICAMTRQLSMERTFYQYK